MFSCVFVTPGFLLVRVAHPFSFLCSVFCVVCLCSMSCVPSVASFSKLSIRCLPLVILNVKYLLILSSRRTINNHKRPPSYHMKFTYNIYNYGLHEKLISIIIKSRKGYFPEVE